MTTFALVVPRAGTGPVVDPLHSAGVAGASHRYVPNREGYADAATFAALHDLIGSANLTITGATTDMKARSEVADPVNLVVARQNAASTVSVLEGAGGAFDLGAAFSVAVVFKSPANATTTITTLDGYSISRAANGSYTWGGNGTNNHSTGGTQTNGWCVAIAGGGTTTFFQLNGVDVASAGTAPPSSQTDRIYLGQRSASARTQPLDFAEVITWPFTFTAPQKAAALAAMRAKYSFVPQS